MTTRPPTPEALPAPVTDTHCHMDMSEGFADELYPVEQALSDAASVGVSRIVQVGCDVPGSSWAVDVAERFEAVLATVALHPNEAPRLAVRDELHESLARIDTLAGSSARVRAIGETGLDHYRTGPDGHAAQEESFRAHAEIARRRDLALVIHDRDAHQPILAVLEELRRSGQLPDRVVFHCFSGDVDMARHCVERGWYLSFAGPVTFKNGQPLRTALSVTPHELALTETDAPFLTPHPHRGRPNSSVQLPWTVRAMAETWNADLATTCQALHTNAEQVFGYW